MLMPNIDGVPIARESLAISIFFIADATCGLPLPGDVTARRQFGGDLPVE
jgi:hypothetical protein